MPFRSVVGIALLLSSGGTLNAQSVTALKTGEKTTGMTKQCFYEFAGNEYTKTIQSVQLCPLSISVSTAVAPTRSKPADAARSSQQQPFFTAFKTGEQTTGMTKQCFYEFAGNKYTKTIQSVQLCPLSVAVPSK